MIYCNDYDHVGVREDGKKVARVDLVSTTAPGTMPNSSTGIENCPVADELLPMSTFLATQTKKVYIRNTDGGWDEQ